MAAHSSTQLANGHTLTVVEGDVYRVEERNELGTFLHVAFTSYSFAKCEAWVARAAERGYGLRPTVGSHSASRRLDVLEAEAPELIAPANDVRRRVGASVGDRIVIGDRSFILDDRRSSDPLGVGRSDGDRYILRDVDPLDVLTEEDFSRHTYYTCSVCGHVETRQAVVEAPARCEHCGAHGTALVGFDTLDAAEALSEEVS